LAQSPEQRRARAHEAHAAALRKVVGEPGAVVAPLIDRLART
jgi:hypothetical protein